MTAAEYDPLVDRLGNWSEPTRGEVARHEAAHAVVLLELGHPIGAAGVTIIGTHCCAAPVELPWQHDAMFSLAGLVVEAGERSEALLRAYLRCLNTKDPNDEIWALRAIRSGMPDASDDEVLMVYRRIEADLESMLKQPDVSARLERVAAELERRGTLCDADVRALC